MSRLATILTAQPALLLSLLLAAAPATIARSQTAPAPTAAGASASPGASAAPKPPTSLANQPVVTSREGVAPAAPKSPSDPVGPDEQKLIDLARQLSAASPPSPASPAGAAPAASSPAAGEKPLPVKRDKSAPVASEATAGSAVDSRPLSGRRRAETAEAGTEAPAISSGGGGWTTILGALTGVVGLIFVLRAALIRWTGGVSAAGRSAVVQVISRVAVAPRNHVLLLRVGGRVLVVGDSPTGMRTLAQIDDAEEIADILAAASSSKPTSISAGFRQMLSGFAGEYTQQDRAAVGSDEQEMRVDRARDKVGGLVGKIRSIAGKGGGA